MARKNTSKAAGRKAARSDPSATTSRWRRWLQTKRFARTYMWLSLAVLLGTTAYWSLLSARLQNSNADQLVNTYLFENVKTFQGALLSGQHTFLLKWPVFYIVHALGATPRIFIATTMLLCLLTVGSFAYILYRIERRPLAFGTLCLALASVLLLIPAQPYPGALLPVNMAMITARNIEYIVLFGGLYALLTSRRLKSWRFASGILVLTLLIASDKLYLALLGGGAVLSLVVYAVLRHRSAQHSSQVWLLGLLVAGGLAILLLAGLEAQQLGHIVGQASASPYGVDFRPHNLVLGGIYLIFGVLTNMGINPTFGTTIFRQMPHQALRNLADYGLLPLIVNGAILLTGLWAVVHLLWTGLMKRPKAAETAKAERFALALVAITAVSLVLFVGTNHYFAADARYVSLFTFMLFVALAVWVRRRTLSAENWVAMGLVLIAAVATGTLVATLQYNRSRTALNTVNQRNQVIAAILKRHPVERLVGDYWRVVPTKLAANNTINVDPLDNCNHPRDILSSTTWQPDLKHHSFAYILSFDQKLTDYPLCSLDQVIADFGRPNSSILIAGTIDKPQEMLLFYDHGLQTAASPLANRTDSTSTIVPIGLKDLPHKTCSAPTIMNIVAHEDDDLLFLSPDLLHDVQAGHCVRTVYLTAGDAGYDSYYWLSREQGSEAAYGEMLGIHDVWVQRTVKLADNEFLTVANPHGNDKIALIFMHLPDGNLFGQGFRASHYESLSELDRGKLNRMHTVDGQSNYTRDQLTTALTTLMHTYRPNVIRSQADYRGQSLPDHSDHVHTGHFVERAYEAYLAEPDRAADASLSFYIGYPVREFAENVTADDLGKKLAAFAAYAHFDSSVCADMVACGNVQTYPAYLHRQYLDQ